MRTDEHNGPGLFRAPIWARVVHGHLLCPAGAASGHGHGIALRGRGGNASICVADAQAELQRMPWCCAQVQGVSTNVLNNFEGVVTQARLAP